MAAPHVQAWPPPKVTQNVAQTTLPFQNIPQHNNPTVQTHNNFIQLALKTNVFLNALLKAHIVGIKQSCK